MASGFQPCSLSNVDAVVRLKSIKSAISAMGHRADLPTTRGGDEVKLIIEGNGIRVKVELNFVFRGTVLPVVQRPLIPNAQELFATDITLPVLDTAELYGSKLVAAGSLCFPERATSGGSSLSLFPRHSRSSSV